MRDYKTVKGRHPIIIGLVKGLDVFVTKRLPIGRSDGFNWRCWFVKDPVMLTNGPICNFNLITKQSMANILAVLDDLNVEIKIEEFEWFVRHLLRTLALSLCHSLK
jgi:hypothetical protein